MESILHEIFHGRYEAYPRRSEGERKVFRRLAPLEEKIADTFGPDFLDQLNTIHADMEGESDYSCFRAGFLLGARLMLEVFSPAGG